MRALLLICLFAGVGFARAHGLPSAPPDYPSHQRVGLCNQEVVQARLQAYNEVRLQLAAILRDIANEPGAAPGARSRLTGYADYLDAMRRELPAPDPDSPAFRNFDFRLGITLTSMTLFLNTEDEKLAARFTRDRNNPDSALGRYLIRLDQSRSAYTDGLAAAQEAACG
jgi:hypothetical protein